MDSASLVLITDQSFGLWQTEQQQQFNWNSCFSLKNSSSAPTNLKNAKCISLAVMWNIDMSAVPLRWQLSLFLSALSQVLRLFVNNWVKHKHGFLGAAHHLPEKQGTYIIYPYSSIHPYFKKLVFLFVTPSAVEETVIEQLPIVNISNSKLQHSQDWRCVKAVGRSCRTTQVRVKFMLGLAMVRSPLSPVAKSFIALSFGMIICLPVRPEWKETSRRFSHFIPQILHVLLPEKYHMVEASGKRKTK